MVFKYTLVLLFASAISCGTIGFRQNVQQIESVPVVNEPVGQLLSVPVTQPLVKSIPTAFLSQSFNGFQSPNTIPESLLTVRRTVDFVIPQTIPVQYLTLTAPGAEPFNQPLLSQTAVQNVVSEVRTPLVSPAQKILSQSTPLVATNQNEISVSEPKVETPETPVLTETAPVTQLGSNSGIQSFSTGFTAQNRPQFKFGSNFVPNLREVQRPVSQIAEQNIPSVETNARIEQLPEPVQQRVEQRIESQEPKQSVAQMTVPEVTEEQRIETNVQKEVESQQIVEPVTQQRIEAIPQQLNRIPNFVSSVPITETRIPASLLSSYSF